MVKEQVKRRQAVRIGEAAEVLGVSRRTVWRWVTSGRVRYLRPNDVGPYRIPAAEIDRLLAEKRVEVA